MSTQPDIQLPPGCYYQSPHVNTVREAYPWTTFDGATLNAVYRYALTATSDTQQPHSLHALVYLHGIESHAAWFDHVADELCLRGFDVYCLDRRGSGLNRESQGFVSGHIDSVDTFLDDLDNFLERLRARYINITVIGLSWGAKLALGSAMLRPNGPDNIILITPGVVARVTLPLTTKLRIFASSFLKPTKQFPIPITPDMFTSDPYFLQRMSADTLRLKTVSARFYTESLRLDSLLRHNIASIKVPIACFFAGRDRIIDNFKTHQFLLRGGGPGLHVVTYDDQLHSIQFDAPIRLADDITEWISSGGHAV